MDKKKFLLLSLGVGSIEDANKRGQEKMVKESNAEVIFHEMVEEKRWRYRNATYVINGKEKNTFFVGDVLREEYNPEVIVIIGTIRSMWDAIYCNLYLKTNNQNENKHKIAKGKFEKLYKLVHQNQGHKEEREVLVRAENEIFDILNGEEIGGKNKDWITIYPILVEYGTKESQTYNYSHIKGMLESLMDENMENEIAFDITHSFRSLPFYNMTTINYLKGLHKYSIKIRHIYYGNLDINSEMNYCSPIEDYSSLAHMLDITSAVEAFRSTGNANLLIEALSEEQDFSQYLRKYDWATQCNDYTGIVDALHGICSFENEKDDSVIEDAQQLVIQMLSNYFPHEILINARTDVRSMAMMQYYLSKWYYSQKQYGLACATGLEALRSFLAYWYVEYRNEVENKNANPTIQECRNEKIRINAVDRLRQIRGRYSKSKNASMETLTSRKKGCDLLIRLENARFNATKVRNVFAHNLTVVPQKHENRRESVDFIETYLKLLDEFVNHYHEKWLREAYFDKHTLEKKRIMSEHKIRFFIGLSKKTSVTKEDYKSKNTKQLYDCYRLPDCIQEKIRKEASGKIDNDCGGEYIGCYLSEYIRHHFEDYKNIYIIFENYAETDIDNHLQSDQIFCYSQVMYEQGFCHLAQKSIIDGQVRLTNIRCFHMSFDLGENGYKLKCQEDCNIDMPPVQLQKV